MPTESTVRREDQEPRVYKLTLGGVALLFALISADIAINRRTNTTIVDVSHTGVSYSQSESQFGVLFPDGYFVEMQGSVTEARVFHDIAAIGAVTSGGERLLFVGNSKKHYIISGYSPSEITYIDPTCYMAGVLRKRGQVQVEGELVFDSSN